MINTYSAQFIGKEEIASQIFKFRFELDSDLHFNAGQYLIFLIAHNGSIVRRLYSISSPQFHTKSFEIIVQIVPNGVASTQFANLIVGDTMQVQGPAGVFTLRENGKPKLFLATGTGVAPILSILHSHLTRLGGKAPRMMLFWGLRTKADSYCIDELRALTTQYTQLDVRICLSRETADTLEGAADIFIPGRIDSVLSKRILVHPSILHNVNAFDYYLCGSVAAVDTLATILGNAGVEKTFIFFEKFI